MAIMPCPGVVAYSARLHLLPLDCLLGDAPTIVIGKVSEDGFNQYESAVPVVIHNKNMLVSESDNVKESVAIDINEEAPRKCRETQKEQE